MSDDDDDSDGDDSDGVCVHVDGAWDYEADLPAGHARQPEVVPGNAVGAASAGKDNEDDVLVVSSHEDQFIVKSSMR